MILSMAGSNLLQVTQKFGTMFGLSTETAQLVAGWLAFADNTLAAMLSAKDFGDFAADMIDKYMVDGAEFSAETVLEIAMLGSYGLQTSTYANYTISMGSYLQTCLDAYDTKLIEDIAAQSEMISSCDSYIEYQDVIDPACFVAGTKVMTADGLKDIEDVEVGDYVLAENPETGEQGYKEVVNTYIHEKDVIVHVYVGDEEIETTREHPFYVEGVGFVQAGSLKPGHILRLADGRNLEVSEVETEHLSEPVHVYNFEVEDYHTYYVSGLGVLVHNTCSVDPNSGIPSGTGKRQTQDQKALRDLAKDAANSAKNGNPISYDEAKILDMWAEEYNVPQHHQAYSGSGAHFPGGNYSDHTHIYNIHVPYSNGSN